MRAHELEGGAPNPWPSSAADAGLAEKHVPHSSKGAGCGMVQPSQIQPDEGQGGNRFARLQNIFPSQPRGKHLENTTRDAGAGYRIPLTDDHGAPHHECSLRHITSVPAGWPCTHPTHVLGMPAACDSCGPDTAQRSPEGEGTWRGGREGQWGCLWQVGNTNKSNTKHQHTQTPPNTSINATASSLNTNPLYRSSDS